MSNPDDFDFYCDVALKPDAEIEKVFESDRVLAYYHTKPFWEKHIVIIPKEHIWDIRHVNDTSFKRYWIFIFVNSLKIWHSRGTVRAQLTFNPS